MDTNSMASANGAGAAVLLSALLACALAFLLHVGVAYASSNWEQEPNDEMSESAAITLNVTWYGSCADDDDDWYKFTLPEDGCVVLTFSFGDADYTGSDLNAKIYDPERNWGYLWWFRYPNETIISDNIELGAGTYYLRIWGASGQSGSGAGYSFSLLYANSDTAIMYRLYNPNSGEHFYTASDYERKYLDAKGWDYEGVGWYAPKSSGTPVYRLYNPNPGPNGSGEHHYTTSAAERDRLVAAGWNDEGIGWYSADESGTPLYRVYNPNEFNNNHHYTTSTTERDYLLSLGWRDEGTAWYGVK